METDGRVLILQELTNRKTRNASYSLRAFARDLGVSPAALSQYLSRKRELSNKNRRLIAEKLNLSPLEQEALIATAQTRPGVQDHRLQISEDTFKLISDWVSVAILSLARLRENQAKATWVSKRLGITESQAKDALQRLMRAELIEVKAGRLQRTGKVFTTTSDVPSQAIRKFHLSVLHKAQEALLDLPVDTRDITVMTMPADPAKLQEAKKILERTRRRIADLLTTDEASEVYVLSMQLFPVSKPRAKGDLK